MRYATAMGSNAYDTYRSIDLVGRTSTTDSGQLVDVLYEECIRALRAAAWAAEQLRHTEKSERISKATAILFALESGLDFERGGDVSRTLATFYHGIRQQIVGAAIGNDPAPFRAAARDMEEIAGAWTQARAS